VKRRDTGMLGEKVAARYLQDKGYSIAATNFHCREGEIDIIAEKDGTLVFVEVKTRRNHSFGAPEESVVPAKMVKLRTAAQTYIQRMEVQPPPWRIDVVAIDIGTGDSASRIEHYENAVGES